MCILLQNCLGAKKHYGLFLASGLCLITTGLACLQVYKAYGSKAQPMAHTPEYNAVVDEHIDTAKVPRKEIDLSVTKQELGQRFVVYQFNHSQLRGKWGDLHVFVDRQLSKTTARSLLPVRQKQPEITVKGECLWVPQAKNGLVQNYEICVR